MHKDADQPVSGLVPAVVQRRRWLGVANMAGGAILVLTIGSFLAGRYSLYRVTSQSMAPTYCSGDVILVKNGSTSYAPKAGEVVLFNAPGEAEPSVKRVVGISGQRVRTDSDLTIVNNQVKPEAYVCIRSAAREKTQIEHMLEFRREIAVLEGAVFVMGDNRAASFDSRDFGSVPIEEILGHVLFRVTSGRGRCVCLR